MKTSLRLQPLTLRAWVIQATRRLESASLFFGHGAGTATEEAVWIAAYSLKCDFEQILRMPGTRMQPGQFHRAEAVLEARIETRKPLAYLLGEAWLSGLRFFVDERVIVPRSFIAELLPKGLRSWLPRPVRSVLDLCTGSACLAILLARRFPRARVDAVDISSPALEVAAVNLRRHRYSRRIELVKSNLFSKVAGRRYDIIVSNPPYVNQGSMRKLPREYRYEPELALAGGKDGLNVVRRILRSASDFLSIDGILVCEIGHNRHVLERAYPRLPFVWLATQAGSANVFLLRRQDFSISGA